MTRVTRLALCALLLFAFSGCERQREPAYQPPPVSAADTLRPFHDPIAPVLYELPSGALATWRDHAALKPTLVLFANHPFLDPVAAEKQRAISALLATARPEELVRRGQLEVADPAFFSTEVLSLALAAGYFSEVVYVLPTTRPPSEFVGTAFPLRAVEAGFLTIAEAEALSYSDGAYQGKVRGVPFRCVHHESLPEIDGPVLIHLDLGYFKDRYLDEVKTPAYDLLHQTATALRAAQYRSLAVTLSFANQEIEFSLESRFLVRDFAELLRRPQLLDGGTPASWTLRAQALYATTMFGESRARELAAQAVEATPDDAAAHYALALDLFEQRLTTEGFAALDRAVSLDRGYALEYLTLAERGARMGKIDEAIELQRKAAQAFPNNPFVRLELVHYLLQAGRGKDARPLIAELRTLPWAETTHSTIQQLLEAMADAAARDDLIPSRTAQPLPEATPARRMPGFSHMGMGGVGE